MPVELKEECGGRILEVHAMGKITRPDYEQFVPTFERLRRQHGKLRVLLQLHDFHGWTTGGLWEDIKFDAKHFAHIERLAIVGEKQWQRGMAAFCKPFTTAKIRFYTPEQADGARQWLETQLETTSPAAVSSADPPDHGE
jgi:hypothetical protein